MRRLSYIAGGVILLTAGCGALEVRDETHFQQGLNQEVYTEGNRNLLVSRAASTIVSLSPATQIVDSTPIFVVGVENVSTAPIAFKVVDVKAYELRDGKLSEPLKIYSSGEVRQKAELRHVLTEFLAGLAAGNADDETGSWDKGNQIIAEVHTQNEQELRDLDEYKIADQVIQPGERFAFQFMVQAPGFADPTGDKTYAIKITVGPDQHEIRITQHTTRQGFSASVQSSPNGASFGLRLPN